MPATGNGHAKTDLATATHVTSKDGTQIVFDRTGSGPPLILVGGAFMNRSFPDTLSGLLSSRLTVFRYDRRGRNDSGDTQPYAVEREVEDIDALINEAGGTAFVYGMSSGAVLALEAAASGLAISKLALFEPPFIVDESRGPLPEDYVKRLDDAIAAGRPGDAVEIFMTAAMEMPAEAVAPMRNEASWPALEAVAHTLAYDGRVMGETMSGRPLPAERMKRWSSFKAPTLVIDGSASWPFMHSGAEALAGILPDARRRTLEGQAPHDVSAEVLAPVLFEFFEGEG